MPKTPILLVADDFDVPIEGVTVTATLEPKTPVFSINPDTLAAKLQVIRVVRETSNEAGEIHLLLPASATLCSPGHVGPITWHIVARYKAGIVWELTGVPIEARDAEHPLRFGELYAAKGQNIGTPQAALPLDATTLGGHAAEYFARADQVGDGGTGPGGPVEWDDIEDKPASYPPTAHTHNQADVTGLAAALLARLPLLRITSGSTTVTVPASGAWVSNLTSSAGTVVHNSKNKPLPAGKIRLYPPIP